MTVSAAPRTASVTPTRGASSRGAGDASHTPPFPKALVEEMLRAFGRAARAHQLYLHNNPIYLKAVDT
ncbi:MAG TPA: hypothetical protein VNS52_06655, partial [Gemmatimonadaceae bacterium]|nr:hypothetical protein [Gemmatimonadaceae bacterium]